MLLFLSGNFPALSSPKKEKELIKKIEDYGSKYKRLLTFYHKKEALVGLNIQKNKLVLIKRKGKEKK